MRDEVEAIRERWARYAAMDADADAADIMAIESMAYDDVAALLAEVDRLRGEDMDDKLTRIFVTKHALTAGVLEVDARVTGSGYAYYRADPNGRWEQVPPGSWFADRPSAVAKANAMRAKKLASLAKQAAKLGALSFD